MDAGRLVRNILVVLLTFSIVFLVWIALSSLTKARAQGNNVCSSYEEISDYLTKKFKESPTAAGISNSRMAIELWVSDDRDTWSLLVHRPGGDTCILAGGTDWTFHMIKIPGRDS